MLKSLITTFVIFGSSAAASAKPVVHFDATASWSIGGPAPVVRDHRVDDHHDRGCDHPPLVLKKPLPMPTIPIQPAPTTELLPHASRYIGMLYNVGHSNVLMPLTQPTRIDNGREDFVVRQGHLDTLQLRAVTGGSFIRKVVIEFKDETVQVVRFNREIDMYSPTLTIDLRGRERSVKRIFVYGTTERGASYQLFAR